MYNVKSLLLNGQFPKIRRERLTILQMNLGYLCNLSCTHCHVNAGPKRTELMSRETMQTALQFAGKHEIKILDVTGGSPEMNPEFRWLVKAAKEQGLHVIDRCNPTILVEPDFEWAAGFLAEHHVEVVASLPCYLEENVDAQRGKGSFTASVAGLKKLNVLSYGVPESGLELNLVYNPQGANLPPPQEQLEVDYRRYLGEQFGIQFNHLYVLANMPIKRFGAVLIANGKHGGNKHVVFDSYLKVLKTAYRPENLKMLCANPSSVWTGKALSTIVTSTKCWKCRWVATSKSILTICFNTNSKTCRSVWPIIVSAAPPGRVRVVLERSLSPLDQAD